MPLQPFDSGYNQAEAARMYKRKRTGSVSSISSSSGTPMHTNEIAQELSGTKTKDKAYKHVGHWKPSHGSLTQYLKYLFPTVHYEEIMTTTRTTFDSTLGEQKVTGNDAVSCWFTREYCRKLYEKMTMEISPIHNNNGNGPFPVLFESDAKGRVIFMPNLDIERFNFTFTVQNVGESPGVIKFIEFLCVNDTNQGPGGYWQDDIKMQPAQQWSATSTFAPTVLQTMAVTDVGRLPQDHSATTLGKYWKITRKTSYDLNSGQSIRHVGHLPGASIPMQKIYPTREADAASFTTYVGGVTRLIMIITHGALGFDTTAATGVGKLLTTPSFWNLDQRSDFFITCTPRCPKYSKLCVVRTDLASWSATDTDYAGRDDATDGNSRFIDPSNDTKSALTATRIDT